MLNGLPKPLLGILSVILLALNTLWWLIWLAFAWLIKWLMPSHLAQPFWRYVVYIIPVVWARVNRFIYALTSRIRWEIHGIEQLNPQTWYLLTANHQAWTDILVLENVLAGKAPSISFFFKKELLWVPIIGQACWLLDFPMMHRHNRTALARHPELRLQDIANTRKACQKFEHIPITLINFAEGTRFRTSKHAKQNSPYKHLLKPKAGGIAFVLSAMDGKIKEILDATIIYEPYRANFWDFCCGKVKKVTVYLRTIPVTNEWLGNYVDDKDFRQRFQAQINQLWAEKDSLIDKLLQ